MQVDFMDPYSSVSAVLSNVDLLYEIFGRFYLKTPLVPPSRLCRTFRDPALDILWNQQDNLSATLALLPQAGLSISDAELTRFETYTKRVRYLRLDDLPEPSVLNMVARLRNGQPLFPSLRTLEMYEIWPLTPTEGALLFCSTLRDIRLWGRQLQPSLRCGPLTPRQQIDLCLQLLSTRSPDLRALSLEYHYIPASRHISALDPVLMLRNFQDITPTIKRDPFSREMPSVWLQKLSVLEHLDRLALSEGPFVMHNTPCFLPNAFSALRHLRVAGQSKTWSQFFSRIFPLCLIDISFLDTQFWLTEEDQHDIYQCMEAIARHRMLERVKVTNSSFSHHDNPDNAIPMWMIVKPLLALHQLRELTIISNKYVTLTDDEVSCMATAWPGLESLDLYQNRWVSLCPTVTSLMGLASHCPQLKDLRLVVDFANLPNVQAVRCMSHRLEFLVCRRRDRSQRIDEENAEKAAAVVDRIFRFANKVLPW
ncbi:unnamed protein product [Somion occarium]|uniref:F-box domain-containing protein n=1 Tax=Somion occarium TaxID=3059160 RepID=A0ABP1DU70_9APHY